MTGRRARLAPWSGPRRRLPNHPNKNPVARFLGGIGVRTGLCRKPTSCTQIARQAAKSKGFPGSLGARRLTAPRAVSRETQLRRTSRLVTHINQALVAMSEGQTLQLQYHEGHLRWSLRNGQSVAPQVAAHITTNASVLAAGAYCPSFRINPGGYQMMKTTIHAVGDETEPPISVGNPLTAADLAIDQSHMEEFATAEEGPPEVTCAKPPKGTFFTVRAETGKPWQDRGFYFLLEMKDRDPYIVAPAIAKLKKEEDVIRPVLIVRYVTMAGEEGLWALKLDPPDGKVERLEQVGHDRSQGRRRRQMGAADVGEGSLSLTTYRRRRSSKPRPASRTAPFKELVNLAFPEDQTVTSLDHEIWDVLENGSEK